MPPSNNLDLEVIAKIRSWIDTGAQKGGTPYGMEDSGSLDTGNGTDSVAGGTGVTTDDGSITSGASGAAGSAGGDGGEIKGTGGVGGVIAGTGGATAGTGGAIGGNGGTTGGSGGVGGTTAGTGGAIGGSGGIGGTQLSFSDDVFAIIPANCSTCHTIGSRGGLNMGTAQTAYNNLVGVSAQGCAAEILVIAGDAENSYLIKKIEGRQPFGCGTRMPTRGALDSASIGTFRSWIDGGALP